MRCTVLPAFDPPAIQLAVDSEGAATSVNPPPVDVNPPVIVIDIYIKPLFYDAPRPAHELFVPPLYVIKAIGPRSVAVLVSVAYVIRCTIDVLG